MYRAAALATALFALAACTRDVGARLLDVHAVTPKEAEPGDVLHVLGGGFPAGREGAVRWTGEARRPGDAPAELDVTAPGRAVSADRVDVPVAGALARALAGATFRGSVWVTFTGRAGAVSGRLSRTMLVVGREPVRDARAEVARTRRAASFARFLGVAFDEESDVAGGARLASVRTGSRAARVGLLSGDVVTSIDGAFVAARDDVLPVAGAPYARLGVRRDGARDVAEIAVPLAGAMGEPPVTATLLALALAVGGLFVLAWLSPLARVVDAWVARTERAFRRGPAAGARGATIGAAGIAAAAALLAARPFGTHVDLLALAVAAAAGRIVAIIAAGGARTPRTLALAALRAVAGLGGVAGLFALLGTSTLAGVVQAQSGGLLALGMLRGPAQLACTLAIVEALVVTEALPAAASRFARRLDGIAGALACALVALVALGGGAPVPLALRPLACGVEAAALAFLAARWRAGHAASPLVAGIVGLGAALAATAVVLAGPHAADDPLLARATAVSCALTIVALGALAVRARHAPPRWELPRFL